MAEDAFGRAINSDNDIGQIREMLRTMMTGNVGKPTIMGDKDELLPSLASIQKLLSQWHEENKANDQRAERTAKATETIAGILSRMEPGFAKEVGEAVAYASAATEVHNAPKGGPADPGDPDKSLTEKVSQSLSNNIGEILKEIKVLTAEKWKDIVSIKEAFTLITTGKLDKCIPVCDNTLAELMRELVGKGGVQAAARGGAAPAAAGARGGAAEDLLRTETQLLSTEQAQLMTQQEIEKQQRRTNRLQQDNYSWWDSTRYVIQQIQQGLYNVEATIMGMSDKGQSVMKTLFGGLFNEEIRFIKDMRAAAYETAGVTKESVNLQKAYEDIGKTVHLTGMDRASFQAAYLKNIRSGTKDLKVAHQLAVTHLNTEKQLGLQAGALADTFEDWVHSGRMTMMQTAEMGRAMRDVARNTGLTGEAMKKAVDASGELIVNLKNAAQLTAASAKNVMEVVANAQKLGVTSQVGTLLKSMTSTTELLTKATGETSGFLLIAATRAGRIRDMMEGTITRTKQGMKDLVGGMEGILKSFGVESMEAIDQLPDEVKFRLNLNLKSAFGMELGEIRNVIESFKESSKTLGDRLDEINKKRKENLTLEERATLMEKERALKAGAALSIVTALDEAAKGAKNMEQALTKFGERRKEFEDDLKGMGLSWKTNAGAAKGAIEQAIANINAGLVKAGKAELKIESKEIEAALKDPTKFRELGEKLSKADQELATAQKAQLDPMSKLNQQMMEINDTLREFSKGVMQNLLALVGTTGLIATLIVTTISQNLAGIFYFLKAGGRNLPVVGNLVRSIEKMFGQGGDDEPEPAPERKGGMLDGIKKMLGFKDPATAAAENAAVASEKSAAAAEQAANAATKVAPPSTIEVLNRIATILEAIKNCTCNKETQASAALAGAGTAKEPAPAAVDAAAPAAQDAKAGGGIMGKVDELKAAGPELLKGAATLAVLAVGVVALATAIMFIANQIVGAAGFADPGDALMVGATILAVVGSAAVIAGAVLAATEALKEIGKLADEKDGILPQLAKGAGVLLILTPAILLLSAALIGMVNGLSMITGINWSNSIETAGTAAAMITAAGAIATAVVGASKALEELGSFADKEGKKIIGMIYKGVGVLGLLLPAMLALSAAMWLFVQGIKLMWTVESANEATSLLWATFTAMGLVAIGVIVAGAMLAGLGKLAAEVTGLIGFCYAGLYALVMLLPAVLALGAVIIAFIAGISALWTVEEAETAVSLVYNTFLAMGMVGLGVVAAGAALVGIGQLAYAAPIIWGYAWIGIGFFTSMAIPILLLTAAMVAFIEGLKELWSVEEAKSAVEIVYATFTALGMVGFGIVTAGAALIGLGALAYMKPIIWGYSWIGVGFFTAMKIPIMALATAMVAFIEGLKELWSVEEANAAVEIVYATFKALGMVATGIAVAGAALIGLGALAFMQPMIWAYAGIGIGFFAATSVLLLALTAGMVAFVEGLRSLWTVEQAKEAVSIVWYTFQAVGMVATAIVTGTAALTGLGALGVVAPWIALMAGVGIAAFTVMGVAVMGLILSVIDFIGVLASIWTVEDAQEAGQLVRATFDAVNYTVAAVTSQANSLAWAGVLTVFTSLFTDAMYAGVAAFNRMKDPVLMLIWSITDFVKSIAAVWTVEDAKEARVLIEEVLQTAGKVIDTVREQSAVLGKLAWMAPMAKIYTYFFGDGVQAFRDMSDPVVEFIKEIMSVGNRLAKEIDLNKAEDVNEAIEAVGKISTNLAAVMKTMTKDLVPFTQGSWFPWRNAPIKNLDDAGKQFVIYMPGIMDFIKKIIGTINTTFKKVDEIEDAHEVITEIGKVVAAIPGMFDNLNKGIVPLTEGSWMPWNWGGTQIDALNDASGKFEPFFKTIVRFVNDGLVRPITTTFKDVDSVEDAAEAVTAMAKMLAELPGMFLSLKTSVVPLTQGSWLPWNWGGTDIDAINNAKLKFEPFFVAIAGFVRDGIVKPIKENFDDAIDLADVLASVNAMSAVVTALPPMFTALVNGLVPLMSDGWFTRAPAKKLSGEFQARFAEFFAAIAIWMNNGIVVPIRAAFGEAKHLETAKASVEAMAAIVTSLPPLFESLINGLVPLFRSGFISRAPAEKLNGEFREKFTQFFWAIANFLDFGVIEPILKVLGNPRDMQIAAQSLKATSEMLAALPDVVDKTINGLPPLLRLSRKMDKLKMGEEDNRVWNDFFIQLFTFLDEAVITPILGILGNPRDMQVAAQSLKATSEMLAALPEVVDKTINGLPPIMRLSRKMYRLKIDKDDSKTWNTFFIDLFTFLDEAVITPILSILGNPRDMQTAAQSLKATSEMIAALPEVVNKTIFEIPKLLRLTPRLEKLKGGGLDADGRQIWNQFFVKLFTFLDEAIITPILGILGNPRDMQIAAESLKATADMMAVLPAVIWSTISAVRLLDGATVAMHKVLGKIGEGAGIYKTFFNELFQWISDGIIDPIIYVLGHPNDMKMAAQILVATTQLMTMLPRFIGDLAAVAGLLTTGWWWFDPPLKGMGEKIQVFSAWFAGIANALSFGIFQPIRTFFPKPEEIQEIVGQLQGAIEVLRILPSFINQLAVEMGVLMASTALATDFSGMAGGFNTFFTGVAHMLRHGVLDPIQTLFPDRSELEDALETLDAVVRVMEKIQILMGSMAQTSGTIQVPTMATGRFGQGIEAATMAAGGGGLVGGTAERALMGGQTATDLATTMATAAAEGNIAVNPNGRQTAATAAPDIQSQLEQQAATVAAAATPTGMEAVAAATEEQVMISRQALEALLQIAASLKPSSVVAAGGGDRVSTKVVPPAGSPPRYFNLTSGLFNQGAATGVLAANV